MSRHRRVLPVYRVRAGEVYNIVDFPLRSGARVSAPWTAPTFRHYTWWTSIKISLLILMAGVVGAVVLWTAAVEFWGIFHGLI